MKPGWINLSLLFFSLIASIGAWLRGASYFNLPFAFDHLRHSHSHVAFQGWIYTLTMILISLEFVPEAIRKSKKYSLQLSLTIVVIVGILISFALQGYALYSIAFSSCFQLLVYWFTYRFFKDSQFISDTIWPLRWIRTGLVLGLISSIAPWFIGILSAKGMSGTEWYEALIYFFMHFQYNGWFMFIAFGLFFVWAERTPYIDDSNGSRFYYLWLLAVFPAYFLSLLGMSVAPWVRIPAGIAALLQLAALMYLMPIVRSFYKHEVLGQNVWVKSMIMLSFIALLLKTLLQGASVWPQLQTIAFFSRNVVMAYMHLSLIGVLSFFFLSYVLERGWLALNLAVKFGLFLLLVGFCVTELLLVYSGLGLGYPVMALFIFSILMALGIWLLLIGSLINKKRLKA